MDNNLIETDFDYAYSHCKEVAISHHENFPVGSLLIPKNKRKYIYSIYAFARYADDIADSEKYSEEEKLKKLNELDYELTKIEKKDFDNLIPDTKYIFIALSNTNRKLNIPLQEYRNLLIAFKQDSVKQRYESFDELISYSGYSANPVGHLVLYVFGYNPVKDENIFEYSDKVCTALQLTNFWQDVSLDLSINRVYIPGKVMNENNYSYEMLFAKKENEEFRKVIKYLVDKTKNIFEEGKEILDLVSGRLKHELKATYLGGNEILNKIEKINYNVLNQRVKLNGIDKVNILLRTIF